MEAFKQPRGMILVVLAALGALAYVAWRPQAGPAVSRPTAMPAVVAPTKQPLPQPTAAPAARPLSQQPLPQPPAATATPLGAGLLGPPALTSTSGPDDWAMEGYNPARTRSINQALMLPLTQRREVRVHDDLGIGSPLTIARGLILVESEHRLRAIDLKTGAQRWEIPLVGLYISPAVAGNFVFVRSEADNKGQMLAFDVNTGKQLWAFTPKRLSSPDTSFFGGHLTSPVAVDGIVYVGAGKEVYALDAANGSVLWEFATKDYVSSSATVLNGRVYISDFRYFYSIDQRSGALAWSYPTTYSIYFSSVAAERIVLLADGDKLTALDPTSGKQLWTAQSPNQRMIPGAVQGSRVFVKTTSTMYALDLATGKELWRVNDRNFISLPAVAGNLVFAVKGAGADTAIVALDAASGQSTWNQPVASLSTSAPVIAGKTIYVRTGDGRVLGFWH